MIPARTRPPTVGTDGRVAVVDQGAEGMVAFGGAETARLGRALFVKGAPRVIDFEPTEARRQRLAESAIRRSALLALRSNRSVSVGAAAIASAAPFALRQASGANPIAGAPPSRLSRK